MVPNWYGNSFQPDILNWSLVTVESRIVVRVCSCERLHQLNWTYQLPHTMSRSYLNLSGYAHIKKLSSCSSQSVIPPWTSRIRSRNKVKGNVKCGIARAPRSRRTIRSNTDPSRSAASHSRSYSTPSLISIIIKTSVLGYPLVIEKLNHRNYQKHCKVLYNFIINVF